MTIVVNVTYSISQPIPITFTDSVTTLFVVVQKGFIVIQDSDVMFCNFDVIKTIYLFLHAYINI